MVYVCQDMDVITQWCMSYSFNYNLGVFSLITVMFSRFDTDETWAVIPQ